MSTQTDVKAVTVSTTAGSGSALLGIGAANPSLGVRVKAVYANMTVAGTVALNDGGSAGINRLTLSVPASSVYLLLPGEGIRFANDVYAAFTSTTGSLTVVYG